MADTIGKYMSNIPKPGSQPVPVLSKPAPVWEPKPAPVPDTRTNPPVMAAPAKTTPKVYPLQNPLPLTRPKMVPVEPMPKLGSIHGPANRDDVPFSDGKADVHPGAQRSQAGGGTIGDPVTQADGKITLDAPMTAWSDGDRIGWASEVDVRPGAQRNTSPESPPRKIGLPFLDSNDTMLINPGVHPALDKGEDPKPYSGLSYGSATALEAHPGAQLSKKNNNGQVIMGYPVLDSIQVGSTNKPASFDSKPGIHPIGYGGPSYDSPDQEYHPGYAGSKSFAKSKGIRQFNKNGDPWWANIGGINFNKWGRWAGGLVGSLIGPTIDLHSLNIDTVDRNAYIEALSAAQITLTRTGLMDMFNDAVKWVNRGTKQQTTLIDMAGVYLLNWALPRHSDVNYHPVLPGQLKWGRWTDTTTNIDEGAHGTASPQPLPTYGGGSQEIAPGIIFNRYTPGVVKGDRRVVKGPKPADIRKDLLPHFDEQGVIENTSTEFTPQAMDLKTLSTIGNAEAIEGYGASDGFSTVKRATADKLLKISGEKSELWISRTGNAPPGEDPIKSSPTVNIKDDPLHYSFNNLSSDFLQKPNSAGHSNGPFETFGFFEINSDGRNTENLLPTDDHAYVPLSFTDLRPAGGKLRSVYFRPFIRSFSENISPQWTMTNYFGRVDPVAVYSNTQRNVNLSFQVVAFSPEDVLTNYRKLAWLTSMCYPQYKDDEYYAGPVLRMRIGDVVSSDNNIGGGLSGIINNIDVSYENTTWELVEGQKLPRTMDVTISFQVLHDSAIGLVENENRRMLFGGIDGKTADVRKFRNAFKSKQYLGTMAAPPPPQPNDNPPDQPAPPPGVTGGSGTPTPAPPSQAVDNNTNPPGV